MKIIRDDDGIGLGGAVLCIEWGLTRCNQKGCHNPPNTIIQGASPAAPLFALCEEHFQQGNVPGGTKLTLEFGPVDAAVVDAPSCTGALEAEGYEVVTLGEVTA